MKHEWSWHIKRDFVACNYQQYQQYHFKIWNITISPPHLSREGNSTIYYVFSYYLVYFEKSRNKGTFGSSHHWQGTSLAATQKKSSILEKGEEDSNYRKCPAIRLPEHRSWGFFRRGTSNLHPTKRESQSTKGLFIICKCKSTCWIGRTELGIFVPAVKCQCQEKATM